MMNFNYLFLHIALLILLLCFSPSFAHNKTHNSTTTKPTCFCFSPSSAHNNSSHGDVQHHNSTTHNSSHGDVQHHNSTTHNSSHGDVQHHNSTTTKPSYNSSHADVQHHNSTTTNHGYKGCFSKVYAFGDSFTDTGNANLLGGLKSFIGGTMSNYYGSTFKLPGQRLCNGRLVIDFICENLAIPYLPPYKDTSSDFSSGVNFAIAGSTSTALSSDNSIHNKIHNVGHTALLWKAIPAIALTFQTQIDWFNKYLLDVECKGKSESACRAGLENHLFWIGEMGINDYASTFGSSIATNWLTQNTVGQVCKLLQTMLEKGAKYIVVQGLPPAGCCPLQMLLSTVTDRDNMGCASAANAIIQAHNDLLQKKLEEFRKQYSHCTIVYADYWNAYKAILVNYKEYQFEEPFKACCGAGGGSLNFDLHSLCGSLGTSTCKNPGQYINWDGVHLTEAMHGKLTDLFLNHGYCQPSFDQLIKNKGCM